MAEIRNTFVKSKMNKDLDDRLLSKGEYRDATNVQISRSEGEDVGALENVLGNEFITNWSLQFVPNLEIIGYTLDQSSSRAFFMATNYTDTSDSELSNPAPWGAKCYILMFDDNASTVTNKYKILVQGRFLNFSKSHPIYGIDLLEDLLFWTDNRNQPRKINIDKAITDNTYYTDEDQISVAKYYPYNAPSLCTVSPGLGFPVLTPGDGVTAPPTTGPHWVLGGAAYIAAGYLDPTDLKVGMWVRNYVEDTLNPDPNYIPLIEPTTGIPLQISRGPEGPIGTGNFYHYEFYTNYGVNFGNSGGGGAGMYTMYPNSKNVSEQYLPPSTRFIIETVGANTLVHYADPQGGLVGEILTDMLLVGPKVNGQNILVSSYDPATRTITFDKNLPTGNDAIIQGEVMMLSWPNPEYISTWPGDKEFLTDKFVRFAYRFKFDDGEFSLISPFTQPAFIPKQSGYINEEVTLSDETVGIITLPGVSQKLTNQQKEIQSSTIVSFFENSVDQVDIKIDMPCKVDELEDKYKVSEIDIIYKESDGLAMQVLETIPVSDVSVTGNSTNEYIYNYQSRKPFRTLPEKETTRVFDKVPIRAQTQSVVGSRVVYGNIIDKHTPPENLNYSIQASPKYEPGTYNATTKPNRGKTFTSYPTHTLKQNRTYQVGIILADKYGRQTDVILSSITNFQFSQGSSDNLFDGSTVFHKYKDVNPNIGSNKWFGDSLKVLFRSKIPSSVSYAEGYPGLYTSGTYYTETSAATNSTTAKFNFLPTNVDIGQIATGTDANSNSFEVSVVDIDRSTSPIEVTFSEIVDLSTPAAGIGVTFHGEENKLGWYSYKVVVKQQAQEYYNAYLPNLTQGEIENGVARFDQSTGYTTLISDNINKIPSDLTEVQPEQTQFRTSDKVLFPRFGGGYKGGSQNVSWDRSNNGQYYIDEQFITVDTIAKVTDLGIQKTRSGVLVIKLISGGTGYTNIPVATNGQNQETSTNGDGVGCTLGLQNISNNVITNAIINSEGEGYKVGDILTVLQPGSGNNATFEVMSITSGNVTPLQSQGIYNTKSNPTIARLTMYNTNVGSVINAAGYTPGLLDPKNPLILAGIEVKPAESRLEIYWETSTSGLVSELNELIDAGDPAQEELPEPAPVPE